MPDIFENFRPGLESPAAGGFAIQPDDGADLPFVTRAVNVGVSGVLHVTMADGSDLRVSLAAGGLVPLRVSRVWATGTTAQDIVGLY